VDGETKREKQKNIIRTFFGRCGCQNLIADAIRGIRAAW
jgi:hypothetical protein